MISVAACAGATGTVSASASATSRKSLQEDIKDNFAKANFTDESLCKNRASGPRSGSQSNLPAAPS
jgi:hypothetical protein